MSKKNNNNKKNKDEKKFMSKCPKCGSSFGVPSQQSWYGLFSGHCKRYIYTCHDCGYRYESDVERG